MNVNGPFGFRLLGLREGAVPNFGLAPGFAAYNSAMFSGDVLVLASGLLSSAPVTGGGAQIAGVAVSFEWMSIAAGFIRRARYYPGNDSVNNANVKVFYSNAPDAIYEVQSTGLVTGVAVPQSAVGKYANFAVGAGGNTQSGNSSYSLDDNTINATIGSLPFVITQIELPPVTDPTAVYNKIRVKAVNINPGA